MPQSADTLALATIDLMPKLEDLFFDDHPLLQRVIKGGVEKRRSGGEYAAFDVVIDGPGTIVKLLTGQEAYGYGRRNIVRQGRVYIPTHIYAFAVEGNALRHAQGPTGIANLLELYPEKAMLDFEQRSVAQVLTGNGAAANIDGLTTVNGDMTYNPDGTALNGLLDFQAQAAQTQTVENLLKEGAAGGVTGWYNQYSAVTSFATNGKRNMRLAYQRAEVRGAGYGPPDLGLTDVTSFNNYYDSLDDQVRYQTEFKGEKGGTARKGLMFHDMELFDDPSIDDNMASATLFPTHTNTGIMYMLNTKTFGILTIGEDDEKETKGFFELRGPDKLEGRDAWGFEIVCAWQLYCKFLKANACLGGTAIA